mgnify:CR=1 FL=1
MNSLHGLLNFEIGGLDCRVITTLYIFCPLNKHVQSTQRGFYDLHVTTADKFDLARTIMGDSKRMVAMIVR